MVLKIIIINRHSFYYKQCNSKVVSDKMKQPIYNLNGLFYNCVRLLSNHCYIILWWKYSFNV